MGQPLAIPQNFHATVADDAISKVSRLFNASLDDIFAELFQNARRSGATKIHVDQFEHPDLGQVISISDDGPGIADPRTLFTLGCSDWSEETIETEDAAGMGFFSLANRRVRIIVQQTGTSTSWVIDAVPDSFSGKKPIKCVSGPSEQQGMTILIASETQENCLPAANHASKYFPLPVIVEGVEIERKDFLEKASHITLWNGIRIGLFHESTRFQNQHRNINFHGVTLTASLPSLSQSHHKSYYALLDVLDCPDLKLVLPARKEVVHNAFFDKLHRQIMVTYFRHIAESGAHTLSCKDYLKAAELGVLLPEATPILRPFAPANADRDSNIWHNPERVSASALLYEGNDDPIDDQNLAEAICSGEDVPKLYEPNNAFQGYAWYDALPRVDVTGYAIVHAQNRELISTGIALACPNRPGQLFIIGSLINGADIHPWQIETDRLVLGPESAHIDEAELIVTQSSNATHADLVDLLTRALFCPSDDHEADSYDKQLQWFTDEAEDAVIVYLDTIDEMRINQTTRTIRRELYWLMKAGADVTIRIHERQIEVFGLDTAFRAAKASE